MIVDIRPKIGYRIPMGKYFTVLGGLVTLAVTVSFSVNAAESAFSNMEGVENFQQIELSRGLPVRGTSSSKVLAEFGEPMEKTGPVGTPAISTWHYEGFNVYFENHLVITTVTTDDHLPARLREIQ